MLDFQIAVDVSAPADRVWAVMRDIERWTEWTPTVTGVRRIEGGPLAVGNHVVIRQPKLPLVKWKITELDDRGRSFTWLTRGPGMTLTARHGVEGMGDTSRAILSLQFSGMLGPLFAWLTRNLNNRYLALEAAGLKARSEGSIPARAVDSGI